MNRIQRLVDFKYFTEEASKAVQSIVKIYLTINGCKEVHKLHECGKSPVLEEQSFFDHGESKKHFVADWWIRFHCKKIKDDEIAKRFVQALDIVLNRAAPSDDWYISLQILEHAKNEYKKTEDFSDAPHWKYIYFFVKL